MEDYLHTLLPIEKTKFLYFKRTRGFLQTMRQCALTSKVDVKLDTLKMFLERKIGNAISKTRQLTALFRNWRKQDNEDKNHEDFWNDNDGSKHLWNEVRDFAKQEHIHESVEPAGDTGSLDVCAAGDGNPIWGDLPDYDQMQEVNKVLTTKAAADTNGIISASRKIFTDRLKKGGSFFLSVAQR